MKRDTQFDILLIANRYPDNNSYGGEFIHVRAKFYSQQNRVAVIEIKHDLNKINISNYDGVTVFRTPINKLAHLLKTYIAKVVGIHSPSSTTLDCVLRFYKHKQIITWHHGSDSLDLSKHYAFMSSDITYDEWKTITLRQASKLDFIRQLLLNSDIKKIFVSEHFYLTCINDLNIEPSNTHIIHNNVDRIFFEEYDSTNRIMKNRVLILRDFGGKKYAADLAMGIINRFAMKKNFNDYAISIHGFGSNWHSWTSPIRNYSNITLSMGYVPQLKIAEIMKEHDVLIVPTRHDTQGLLMCEGMAAGLLCVTNSNSAIPEFISNKEGVLVESDDPKIICERMYEVISNSTELHSRRLAAKKRAFNQCGPQNTVEKELDLFHQMF